MTRRRAKRGYEEVEEFSRNTSNHRQHEDKGLESRRTTSDHPMHRSINDSNECYRSSDFYYNRNLSSRSTKKKLYAHQRFVLCKYWSVQGECRNYQRCRYKHDILLVTRVPHAHEKGIYAVCSVSCLPSPDECQQLNLPSNQPIVVIYTASQDKSVKRWLLYSLAPSDSNTTIKPKLQIHLSTTIFLETACLALYFDQGCLVCGLNNGILKVFDTHTSRELTLKGHSNEIHCVSLIDNLLVSSDWDGQLKIWKPNSEHQTFVETVTINVGSSVTTFIEVQVPNGRQLWVGCTACIQIVDLIELKVIKSITMEHLEKKTVPVVMSLLAVEEHVICCLLGGVIKVYSIKESSEVFSKCIVRDTENFCSMTGSSSQDGPVLVCGRQRGVVSILDLPSLEERFHFKYHDKDVRAVHNLGGVPSYFVTTSFDGTLCVWYWSKPE